MEPPEVALYAGPGAELANDVEIVIQGKIPYKIIDANAIITGDLEKFTLLIMPGGVTAHYIPNLRREGCNAIKSFLTMKGGKYLGICAGAYLAGTPELGVSQSKMIREAGIYNCEVELSAFSHPIFEGQKSAKIIVYYQNGPHIKPHPSEKSLALYEDRTSSVIEVKSGCLIFSWHPEKLPSTVPILLNSIAYLLKKNKK
ncbi:MAG: BPL-N domain-containing protein [Candidatus Helarchaeota archaeon]|nr:BPL-N domain-containing protein [Candidatus Helarchaeota archaeon]